ncbi:oligosaccharide flippase family protein [Pseudoalteromonas sp. Of11M-6]|uniref:oligosaccharide flippase family protein n=1 Tax=Pseudoalteromonas sp. Of11M-6 TaxID=2917754 RepID=UPI001EF7272D|nr:oligosaccharide flippase family protein [Pseudoalteromonas sp. Of11M-6]MCG7555754.1 oligosaccharide flippase family protein [Pseudoalteromonas sp. Of11M-6]
MLKESFQSALANLARMLSGLVLIKLISINLGVTGLGELGHYINIFTILTMLSGGGIAKYIISQCSKKASNNYRNQFLNESALYSLVTNLIIIFLVLISVLSFPNFYEQLNVGLIVILSFFIVFFITALNFCNGFIIARGFSKLYYRNQILGSATLTILAYLLIEFFGFNGAILASFLSYCIYFITGFLLHTRIWLNCSLTSFVYKFDLEVFRTIDFRPYLKYSLMILVSCISAPLCEIIIRQNIIVNEGLAEAGYWQALTRLSAAYMSFFTIILTTVYLPKLSRIGNNRNGKLFSVKFSSFLILLFSSLMLLFYFLGEFIITILFSREFIVIESSLIYQNVGDFFKILCMVFGFYFLSFSRVKYYILLEFLMYGTFVFVVVFSNISTYEKVVEVYMFCAIFTFSVFLLFFLYNFLRGGDAVYR